MGRVYQDLEERTFRFAIAVIRLLNRLPKNPGNQVIVYQEIKAVTSINSNVVQGRAGVSRKDFINHYRISLKEARESIVWLRMLLELNDQFAQDFNPLIKENDEIIRILVTSVRNADTK